MALDWDNSYDFALSEIEMTEQLSQTSALTEEQVTVLKQHIEYHSEMKGFLEGALLEGQSEEPLALRVFFENNKPKKPKTNITNLFQDNSCQEAETVHTTHVFLKTKLLEQSLPNCSSLTLSGLEDWSSIAAQI